MSQRPGGNPNRGSAVLVHGLWSNPDDWKWVTRLLRDSGVHVSVPDVPTHRSGSATLVDDAEEVRRTIRSCPAPVVVAGWSYGGKVISMAAAGEASVARLVYVADIPSVPRRDPQDATWLDQDPHILVADDNTFVLDNEWWLREEAEAIFTGEVLEHCRQNPRRPAAKATMVDPQTTAAWQTVATTVLLGQTDELMTDADRQGAMDLLDDVRVLDSDHFVLFRHPQVIADVVMEALDLT